MKDYRLSRQVDESPTLAEFKRSVDVVLWKRLSGGFTVLGL